MESISTEGDESINPVRSKESRGTCKTSKGSRDGSAGSIYYVKQQTGRYPGEISGSMSHGGGGFSSGPSMTYYHQLRTCAAGDLQRILNAVYVTNQAR